MNIDTGLILETVFLKIGHYRVIKISARYDCLSIRINLQQFPNGLFTAYAPFDGEVQYYNIKGDSQIFLFFVCFNGFCPVIDGLYFVAQPLQHLLSKGSQHLLIIHHQQPFLRQCLVIIQSNGAINFLRLVFSRKIDIDSGSCARR